MKLTETYNKIERSYNCKDGEIKRVYDRNLEDIQDQLEGGGILYKEYADLVWYNYRARKRRESEIKSWILKNYTNFY